VLYQRQNTNAMESRLRAYIRKQTKACPLHFPTVTTLLLPAARCPVARWQAGSFATLLDVVNHYDTQFNLNLSDANKRDLVEYLKGI
jgi:hypothetical protein